MDEGERDMGDERAAPRDVPFAKFQSQGVELRGERRVAAGIETPDLFEDRGEGAVRAQGLAQERVGDGQHLSGRSRLEPEPVNRARRHHEHGRRAEDKGLAFHRDRAAAGADRENLMKIGMGMGLDAPGGRARPIVDLLQMNEAVLRRARRLAIQEEARDDRLRHGIGSEGAAEKYR